jgi:rubrerythrin
MADRQLRYTIGPDVFVIAAETEETHADDPHRPDEPCGTHRVAAQFDPRFDTLLAFVRSQRWTEQLHSLSREAQQKRIEGFTAALNEARQGELRAAERARAGDPAPYGWLCQVCGAPVPDDGAGDAR